MGKSENTSSKGSLGCLFPVIIGFAVLCYIATLICGIKEGENYIWYHGIWHGLFFPENWGMSFIFHTPYKAYDYTTAYNVFFWICAGLTTLGYLTTIIFIIWAAISPADKGKNKIE